MDKHVVCAVAIASFDGVDDCRFFLHCVLSEPGNINREQFHKNLAVQQTKRRNLSITEVDIWFS